MKFILLYLLCGIAWTYYKFEKLNTNNKYRKQIEENVQDKLSPSFLKMSCDLLDNKKLIFRMMVLLWPINLFYTIKRRNNNV